MKNVAILGATGAVGREMLKVLEERNFPIAKLKLLASERSVGKLIPFKGENIAVELADENAFEGIDIVLGAATDIAAVCDALLFENEGNGGGIFNRRNGENAVLVYCTVGDGNRVSSLNLIDPERNDRAAGAHNIAVTGTANLCFFGRNRA